MRRAQRDTPPGRQGSAGRPHERADSIGSQLGWNAFTQPDDIWIGRRPERGQHLGVSVHVPEGFRQHTNDRERLGLLGAIAHVGFELAADDRPVASEAGLPEAMADERHLGAAPLEITRVEPVARALP